MRALILVDLQNDFTPATSSRPAGALAVPDGNAVVPIANGLMDRFELVIASQDWHPPGHKSFASEHPGHKVGDVIQWKGLQQILWPDHCVQNTPGAAFVPELRTDGIDHVVRKAVDPDIDSYSTFFDNGHARATGLAAYLREHDVETIYLAGLATDYCVKFSACDARELGLETYVVLDACRGIDREPGDVDRAVAEMRDAGVKIVRSHEV